MYVILAWHDEDGVRVLGTPEHARAFNTQTAAGIRRDHLARQSRWDGWTFTVVPIGATPEG